MEVSPNRTNGIKAKSKQLLQDLKRKLRSRANKTSRLYSQVKSLDQRNSQLEQDAKKLRLENEILKAQLMQARLETPQPNETLERSNRDTQQL